MIGLTDVAASQTTAATNLVLALVGLGGIVSLRRLRSRDP
jgi:MYXO-CTERM domain-containing protein